MEVAGLVIGAISLSSLFDTVITNLDRIRIGRNLGESYESYILRLEVLKLRLHRWRDAVSKLIEEGGQGSTAVKQADGALAHQHLKLIEDLLQNEETLSEKFSSDSDNDSAPSKRDWLVRSIRCLSHGHRRSLDTSHTTNTPSSTSVGTGGSIKTTLRNQVSWAISGDKGFEDLFIKVSTYVDNLEHIVSTQEMEQELDKMRADDVKEVLIQPEANKKDTDFLKEVSLLIDHKFAELVKEKPKNEWVRNTFEDQVKVIQGDVVSSDYSGPAVS
ncbi:putative heterokaryon incompatibility protein [Rhypophila decipiens]